MLRARSPYLAALNTAYADALETRPVKIGQPYSVYIVKIDIARTISDYNTLASKYAAAALSSGVAALFLVVVGGELFSSFSISHGGN